MFGLFKKKVTPFDKQLIKLSELGISLNPGIQPDALFEEHSQKEFEEDPYQLLLISLGGEIFKDDKFFITSDSIWHLDTECIEDHGDYIAIIERLKKLTKLDVKAIKDFIDIENEIAWVSFEFNNNKIKWNLRVDDDWIDPIIFNNFSDLLEDKTSKRIVISTLGQDCLITYLTELQLKEINRLVKYQFK
ncbi:hypothetical protein ACFO9Q_10855 [Paenibacillus sp. GCM10023252]|uniref:hypothetical protein n=1 Tax=Paenibacillus sp. GCM10023252 TaxID=3252649 RepID=UPI003610A9F6